MKVYRHKLSREDAETGTILIEKRAWAMFPAAMVEFAVDVRGRRFATRIVAEDCACRGLPHQHRHLEAGHFRERLRFAAGDVVAIAAAEGAFDIRNG